jgi:hypothetical protein|tara:strand:- start:54 stop:329 length:276 start_codon:yes stop_codon:yes gene_type:complete
MIKLKDILQELKSEGSLPITVAAIRRVKNVTISDNEPEDVKDFWGHHHIHPGIAAGMAEPDTYDTDDDTESDPGIQYDDPDEEESGYEPVN